MTPAPPRRLGPAAAAAAVLAVATLFGGLDQYLGSRTIVLGVWASTASQVSAAWLAVAFVAGMACAGPRAAAALGVGATYAALGGYFLMTVSPVESVPLAAAPGALGALVATQGPWLVGGLASGVLFGVLGQRFRAHGSYASALPLALAFCLEPAARVASDFMLPGRIVWELEIVAGLAFAAVLAVRAAAVRRIARG